MDALSFSPLPERPALRDTPIFLAASIPDPTRWKGNFDALGITDAVVAFGRAAMGAGMHLVTAAHPTIAPLLLYVAAELPVERKPQVSLYQSELFKEVLPHATRRFESDGIALIHWTAAVEGESIDPENRGASLRVMRQQMLDEAQPAAACFIGGMEGIHEEFNICQTILPEALLYPIGGPGGEARRLAKEKPHPALRELPESRIYPSVWRRVFEDLERRLQTSNPTS